MTYPTGIQADITAVTEAISHAPCRCDPHPPPALRCSRCKGWEAWRRIAALLDRQKRDGRYGKDCPKCDGGRMYPWDASQVYPDAESRVEFRCTNCGHREPIEPPAKKGGDDA